MAENDLKGLLEKVDSAGSAEASSGNPANDMVSQRSENSVLFSLSNLTAVGDRKGPRDGFAGSGGEGQADKSGLIDLNTLARMGHDAPVAGVKVATEDGGLDAGATAMPALFNVGTRRSNKGLYLGIAFLVLVVVGLGVFLTYLLVFRAEEESTASTGAAGADEAVAEEDDLGVEGAAAANKAKETEVSTGKDSAAEGGDPENPDEAGADGETADGGTDGRPVAVVEGDRTQKTEGRRTSRGGSSDPGAETQDSQEVKSDKVDDALSKIRRGGKDRPKLDKAKVGQILKASVLSARTCGSGGDLTVQFNIKPTGGVSGVSAVGGSLVGSPTEKCILKVVKGLDFPESDTGAQGVKFPYKL